MDRLLARWQAIEAYVVVREPGMTELWERVVALAEEGHAGQKRNNGDPYLQHVLEVAEVLCSWRLEPLIVLAGVLHDVVRYGHFPEIRSVQGRLAHEELASLLRMVHRLAQHDSIATYVQGDNSRLQKIFDLMMEDVRAVLVRCANRLANLRHPDAFTREQHHLLLLSSAEVYLPLLERLGMWQVRSEVEDHLFQAREPEQYAAIERARKQKMAERAPDVATWRQRVEEALRSHGLAHAEVGILERHVAHIQRKLSSKSHRSQELAQLDARHLFGTYVLVDSVEEAYRALGAVHSCGAPSMASFRDYFAQPKDNGYAALHTTVIWNSQPHRLYLRTHRLHDFARKGILTPAAYNYWYRHQPPKEWQPGEQRILERFLEALEGKQHERLMLLTPRGDIIELPEGATVLDFAYAIHTEVGRQTNGAFVNGVEVPLHSELHSGDVVEIRKDLGQEWPDPQWLEWVRTGRARDAIQAQLGRHPERRGRTRIDRVLRKRGRKLDDLEARLSVLASRMGSTPEELFVSVARGNYRAEEIANQLLLPLPSQRATFQHFEVEPTSETRARFPLWHPEMILAVECCSPHAGDPIAGYYSERGIALHYADCPNLLDPSRIVGLQWKSERVEAQHVDFKLRAINRKGLIHELTQVILRASVDIVYLEGQRSGAMDEVRFTLEVANKLELGGLINTLRQIPGVNGVEVNGRGVEAAMVDLSPFLTPPQPIPLPFSPGRPVSGEGHFWGRQQEIQLIESYLSGQNTPSLLVKGPRRIGKTSLLKQLGVSRAIREHYRFAFVDLQGVASSGTADVLRSIARRLRSALDNERRTQVPATHEFEEEPLETFQGYLSQLTDSHRYAHKKILLALDEFGTLVESVRAGRLDFQLFQMLRSVMQHNPLVTLVLCTSDDVAEMLQADGVLEMFNVTQKVRLAHLDPESAQHLIQEPLRGQVYFDPDAISALLSVTDCHPYYLQILGANLITQLNKDQRRHVFKSDIDEVAKRHTHLNLSGSEFMHLWEREKAAQQLVLQVLCGPPAASPLTPFSPQMVAETLSGLGLSLPFQEIVSSLDRLVRLETLARVEEPTGATGYFVRVELFRRWFTIHYPLRHTRASHA